MSTNCSVNSNCILTKLGTIFHNNSVSDHICFYHYDVLRLCRFIIMTFERIIMNFQVDLKITSFINESEYIRYRQHVNKFELR